MPSPNPPKRLRAPSPQNHKVFDSWNSSSTGHQRAELKDNSVRWRDVRTDKLERQFRSGHCDESTGPSMAFDGTCGSSPGTQKGEWKWVSDAAATRAQSGVGDIRHFMGVGKRKAEDGKVMGKRVKVDADRHVASAPTSTTTPVVVTATTTTASAPANESTTSSKSNVFDGITVYINGSTLPQISDHRLKHLLTSHGARVSSFMARKSVSHVIIGQPSSTSAGAGGGLSARKLQQEIERGGWKGVRVVGVDWALESIKAGKRLAESRFAVLSIAPKGQRSVVGMFWK